MKHRHSPADMDDDTLVAALALAEVRRLFDGRLGARTLLADVESEVLERTWARSPETAS